MSLRGFLNRHPAAVVRCFGQQPPHRRSVKGARMRTDSPRGWIWGVPPGGPPPLPYIAPLLLGAAPPAMMADLGIGAASTGVLLSAFFWSYTIMQVPAGWLVDRYGSKRVLAAGYALWSLSCAMTGWGTSFGGLIPPRLRLGIGESPVYPARFSPVARAVPGTPRGP